MTVVKILKYMLGKYTNAQKWSLIATVVLFILFLLPWQKILTRKPKIKIEDNQIERIDNLERQVKKFQVQQIEFDSAFKSMGDSIVSLQYEIEKKELQILKLKTKKHETIDVVRSYNDSDITNFFTNRYK